MRNYLVNIEKTNHYVPRRVIKKSGGAILHPSNRTKRAAGYIIDYHCASRIIHFMDKNKANRPIDSFITEMKDVLKYNIYWIEPSIVSQGSKNGTFASELSGRKENKYYYISSIFRDFYQKHIVTNFSDKRMQAFTDVKRYE